MRIHTAERSRSEPKSGVVNVDQCGKPQSAHGLAATVQAESSSDSHGSDSEPCLARRAF